MKWLNKLDELLNEEFNKSSWADELKEGKDLEKFESNIEEKERNINIKAFQFLNLSVLEGEYIQNEIEFGEKIKLLFSKVGSLQKPLISNDDSFEFTSLFNQMEFLYTLKKAIEFYKRIANNIFKQIRNLHKNIVIDVSDTFDGTGKYFLKNDNIFEESLFDLFNHNLVLIRTAFFLENNNGEFRYLLETKDTLEKLRGKIDIPETSFSSIIEVLIELCVFLQRKLIIRISQDENRINDGYVFNLEEFNFSLDQHPLKFRCLNDWDSYSQDHYYSETSKERENLLKRNVEKNLKEIKPEKDFLIIHSFIKYYKDINPNLTKLKELKSFFEKYKPKNEFDEFALNISRNYLMNNILSLKMTNIKFDEIDEIINEYKEFQESYSINNFFPFFKICSYLKDFIRENLQNDRHELSMIEKSETALTKLKHCFKMYEKNFQWSEQHLFYAYQLPFEESRKSFELDDAMTIKLFIPCSFLLKIDYFKFSEFSKEIEYFILNSEVELKSVKSIIAWNKKITDKEQEFQKELKEQSKRNIELLGIFSAIIALLFQGVNTVNSKSSFNDKLLIFILMFISLFSFLFMIRVFFDKSSKLNKLKIWFELGIFILMFLILLILESNR